MSDPKVLEEVLAALEMPPEGLAKWFEHLRGFCRSHGGERHYAELLELLGHCESALAARGRGTEQGGPA